MSDFVASMQSLERRQFFRQSGMGLGALALGSVLCENELSASSPVHQGLSELPHSTPRAKRIILLLQSGAPSQVDLFDHKPLLTRRRGEVIPDSVHKGQRVSTMTSTQPKVCLGAIEPMKRRGKTGQWVSDMLPHTAKMVDDLCFVKSMKTESVNHAPAMTFLMTGSEQPGRPSMGAWLSYGLGTEAEDLPAFCVMTSQDQLGSCGQLFYNYYWGSGFLPSTHQGVQFRSGGDPVLFLADPPGIKRGTRREILDGISKLNRLKSQAVGDPEIDTRISQYEMAYRMQTSVPSVTDLSTEPQHVLDMYGPDVMRRGSYAFNCLMARRMAQKGVRFIQLMHSGWDQHSNLPTQLSEQCRDTDQPSWALVQDLKQCGLLDDTIVVWGGEFGRTPFVQGDLNAKRHGRDHHPYCFTIWATGGGFRPGHIYGETDEYGYNIVRDEVHIHDLQATIMHLMGINHKRLTYKFQGRNFRLTDVRGEVASSLLA